MTKIQAFVKEHGLTQREIAEGSDIGLSDVNAIIRGKQRPRTDTVNKFLAFCRSIDPGITYDDLFLEGFEVAVPQAAAAGDP